MGEWNITPETAQLLRDGFTTSFTLSFGQNVTTSTASFTVKDLYAYFWDEQDRELRNLLAKIRDNP